MEVHPDVTISALLTLQVGDVVRIAFDTKGSLNGLEIYLSQQETLTGSGKTTSSNYNVEHRFIFGKIASVEFDSSLNMYVVAYYISDPSDIETVFVSSGNIIAVEEGRREPIFSPVSIDGLKTSEYYGTAADNILIKTTWTVCNQMYVFTK